MKAQSYKDILGWYLTFERMLAANPQMSHIYKYFASTDVDKSNVSMIAKLHLELRKKFFSYPEIIVHIVKCIDAYQQQILGISKVPNADSKFIETYLKPLKENGFTRLPQIKQTTMQDMYDYLSKRLVQKNPLIGDHKSELAAITDVRHNIHVGIIPEKDVINCPHALDIALSPNILALAEKMIGATPTLISAASWWSFSGRNSPTEAQNYHVDFDDYKFVKLFIYLTDVDMQSGPHAYVTSTHDRKKIGDILNAQSAKNPEVYKWYVESKRKTDAEIDKYIGIKPSYLEGDAGSCFMVDTSGIHKGQLPISKDRLLLQFTYGCTPSKTTYLDPIQIGTEAGNNINPTTLTPPNDYIARLFVNR